MALPNTLHRNKGFTLIEIMISIGILAIITGLGLFVSMDFARSYSSRSEQNTVVSVLEKARSQSMNNIDQARHGVDFQGNPVKYVIFECASATPQCTNYANRDASQDITIASSYNVSIPSPVAPFDVVFNQLDGTSTAQQIKISDGVKTYTITVNSEGRIDW